MATLTDDQIATRLRQVVKQKTDEALEPADRTAARDTLNKSITVSNPADADPKRGFRSHREFLNVVMKAFQNPGKRFDNRLIPLLPANAEQIGAGNTSDDVIRKALGSDEAREISDPYGGFLLPTAFSPDFLKVDPEADPIGGKTRNVPMGMPIVKVRARTDKNHTTSVSGGLTVTRRPETVAGTSSQMTFEQITLEAHELFGLAYATESLLRDSPMSFTALLADGFQDQFAYALIKERLYGTGIGEYLGILTALDSSGLGPTVSVAKETGQPAATIVYENLTKMRSRCWGYPKAVWLANHDTYPQLAALNQAVGTGGTAMIWQPSAREDRPDMLLGRPIYFSEYCKAIGTQGDIILANWGEYLEGVYQPMASDESIHVRFTSNERAFKFWVRNAGMPWWKTALTPAYSTSKLSPFVVLDNRS